MSYYKIICLLQKNNAFCKKSSDFHDPVGTFLLCQDNCTLLQVNCIIKIKYRNTHFISTIHHETTNITLLIKLGEKYENLVYND